jgi:hypothetical protein
MTRLLVLLPLLLGGCSTMVMPSADQMKALAGDPNAICLVITSIYASVSLDRNHGCPNNASPTILVPASMQMQVIKP